MDRSTAVARFPVFDDVVILPQMVMRRRSLLQVPKLLKAIEDNDENTIREITEFWLKDAARKATEENDRMSQLGLAVSLENKGNMSEAIKWYRKAAENGDHLAQYRLGNFYDKGEGGVQQDKAEAVKWFRMGAEQNVINCQYVLGLHYENGDGVDKDMDEALSGTAKRRKTVKGMP